MVHLALRACVSVCVQQWEPAPPPPQPEGPAHLPRCGGSVLLGVQAAAETGSAQTDSTDGQALALQQAGLELVRRLPSRYLFAAELQPHFVVSISRADCPFNPAALTCPKPARLEASEVKLCEGFFSLFFVVVVFGCNEISPPSLFMQICKQINLEYNKKKKL